MAIHCGSRNHGWLLSTPRASPCPPQLSSITPPLPPGNPATMSYVHSSTLNNDYQTPDGESLPAYEETAAPLSSEHLALASAAVLAAHEEAHNPAGPTAAETIKSLFDSIADTSDTSVAYILSTSPTLVNPNSRDCDGKTALAAAVETGNIRMVEMLINMGADVDLWSVQGESYMHKYYFNRSWFSRGDRYCPDGPINHWQSGNPGQGRDEYPIGLQPAYQILRTPLMIAAEKGYLPIVRLLFNTPCNADHTLCAPDGQIALRLAVENGPREVVDFLPSLRKGGFRRFKYKHAALVYQIKETAPGVWLFVQFFVWDIPKWIAKTAFRAVKHVVTVSIPKAAKATWRGLEKSGRYIRDDLPGAISRTVRGSGRAIKRLFTVMIPKAAKGMANFSRKLVTEWIPNATKKVCKFAWKLVTVHLPHTLHQIAIEWFPALCKTVARGLQAFAVGSWRLLISGMSAVASLLHTIFEAVISFFRKISLRDIWNAVVQVLKWVFVEVPVAVGKGLRVVGKGLRAIYRGVVKWLEEVFGSWGMWGVIVCEVLVYVLLSFFLEILLIAVEYFKALAMGGKEVLIWFNPKR